MMDTSALQPRAAYIHVPFCRHRCGYCDFTLVAGRDDLIGDYLQALTLELRSLEERHRVETIFLGGGTPTHLSEDQLARLFEELRHWFHWDETAEVSIEANPLDLTDAKIALLADLGVNRISLGVQSFQSDLLRLLERDHTPDDIHQTISRLKRRFDNISLDLIFAVPGQSLHDWSYSLEQAVSLEPTHLSTYCLTIEKGTSFWSRRSKGDLATQTDEVEQAMYAMAINHLTQAGYEHYEISNFAKSGYRCRHNEVYWKGLPYFAFGPGAARYVNGIRETNHRSVTTWMKRLLNGESPVADVDKLPPEDRARETLVISLRRLDGLNRHQFKDQTGFSVEELTNGRVDSLIAKGWIEAVGDTLKLTHSGLFMADTVAAELL